MCDEPLGRRNSSIALVLVMVGWLLGTLSCGEREVKPPVSHGYLGLWSGTIDTDQEDTPFTMCGHHTIELSFLGEESDQLYNYIRIDGHREDLDAYFIGDDIHFLELVRPCAWFNFTGKVDADTISGTVEEYTSNDNPARGVWRVVRQRSE